MKIFLSCEAEKEAGNLIFHIRNKLIQPYLSFLSQKTYGEEFVDIGIITIVVSQKMLNEGFCKERRLISRKNKSADIRLQIDYERFIHSDIVTARLLYIKNIVDSIEVVQERAKGDFQGKELISDILEALNVQEEQLNLL